MRKQFLFLVIVACIGIYVSTGILYTAADVKHDAIGMQDNGQTAKPLQATLPIEQKLETPRTDDANKIEEIEDGLAKQRLVMQEPPNQDSRLESVARKRKADAAHDVDNPEMADRGEKQQPSNKRRCIEEKEIVSSTGSNEHALDDSFCEGEIIDLGESIVPFEEALVRDCGLAKVSYGDDAKTLQKAGYSVERTFGQKDYHTCALIPSDFQSGRTIPGCIFAHHTRVKEIVIVYRGTQDSGDIKTDCYILPADIEFLPEQNGIRGKAHGGFYEVFKASREPLIKTLEHLAELRSLEIKDLRVKLIGHSMGGAVAQIAALYLKKKKDIQHIRVTTFGCPPAFDSIAVNMYNDVLRKHTVNVAHPWDPVTFPVPGLGYAHVGISYMLPTGIIPQHGIDTYYNGLKSLKTCLPWPRMSEEKLQKVGYPGIR